MAFWTTRGVFTECKVGCTIACHIMAKANCCYQHDEFKKSANIHYNETYESAINADEKFVYKDCRLSRRRLQFTNKQTMSKKLIQKLQQLLDKLPKGKERKAIKERLLNLKLNKNKV